MDLGAHLTWRDVSQLEHIGEGIGPVQDDMIDFGVPSWRALPSLWIRRSMGSRFSGGWGSRGGRGS